jgi:uncharacterized membrane protein
LIVTPPKTLNNILIVIIMVDTILIIVDTMAAVITVGRQPSKNNCILYKFRKSSQERQLNYLTKSSPFWAAFIYLAICYALPP